MQQQSLEGLTWNQLVEELRGLASQKPRVDESKDEPRVVLHNLFVHQVELEMQNRELRDAQQRLETSRARYADLYDFAPVCCLTMGPDERVQEINLSGAALLGRPRAEIVGKPFLAVVPIRENGTVFHDHVRRCLEGRTRTEAEIEFLPKGRASRFLHITSEPVIDTYGTAVACRMALTDLTDRRRAELAEANARMTDQFIGTVSHELRTPLTAILAWATLLRAPTTPVSPAVLDHGLEVIARNAAIQGRLIEDILDVSSILAGKLRVDLVSTHLEPLVRATVDSARPAAAARQISLSVSFASERVDVLGDTVRLQQVLANLLNNSIKFTPPGGTIDVSVATEDAFVRIVVRDTGRGIAPEDLPHVFERFNQVDSSTTRNASGLGLGLAIVEHIMAAHGGNVVASSPGLGLGAAFAVRLRRANTASEAPAAPVPSPADSLAGVAIVCVDDDADGLEVMTIVLRERGAVVRTARSASEALALLAEATPDVLVSDIGLPGEDGYALMKQVRALPGDAGRVPTIALTAYSDAASAERIRNAGFQLHVGKPIALDAFVRAIATVARDSATADRATLPSAET
jgi:PAS domain S-box-containing protein